MPESLLTLPDLLPGAFSLGRIVRLLETGGVLVDFPGNPRGALRALVLRGALTRTGEPSALSDAPVLLAFASPDRSQPIIVGLVEEAVAAPAESRRSELTPPVSEAPKPGPPPRDIYVDGRRMVLEGKEEVVLRSGKASITLCSDGRIDIKGGTVRIN